MHVNCIVQQHYHGIILAPIKGNIYNTGTCSKIVTVLQHTNWFCLSFQKNATKPREALVFSTTLHVSNIKVIYVNKFSTPAEI